MDKKELINEIAKYACNACEMGGDFDGDCHDLIGEYTTCGICQGTANKIYDDFICKYIEELNEKIDKYNIYCEYAKFWKSH